MSGHNPSTVTDEDPATLGRLTVRPPTEPAQAYRRSDWLDVGDWESEFYAPPAWKGGSSLPLVVLLHGAGGAPERTLQLVGGLADELGFLVFAPKSQEMTWDILEGGFGPDVRFIDEGLRQIFKEYPIAPDRIAIAGFSDGASYALSLGLSNGDLFSDVIAFSPGFALNLGAHGRPRVFISHGEHDRILSIDMCARPTARQLAHAGYDVRYEEFPGGHRTPPELVETAFRGFMGEEDGSA